MGKGGGRVGRGGAGKNFQTRGDQRLQKWPHLIYYLHIPPTPTMDTHIYTNTTYDTHTPIHRPHIPHVQAKSLQSCPLCATLWTVAHQAPLSMGFSRQEYWSGLLCLLQRIFPSQGSNPHLLRLLYWQVGSLPLVLPGKPTHTIHTHTHTTQLLCTHTHHAYHTTHTPYAQTTHIEISH